MEESAPPTPSLLRYILAFAAVGLAWGFTTPFMRRAALTSSPKPPARLRTQTAKSSSWPKRQLQGLWISVVDLLSRPSYFVPLLLNLSGSVWFFLLVGQAELSLTVPITNSLAFLFTVLGEYFAEGKVIARDTWLGMALVLAGIGLCVLSKTAG